MQKARAEGREKFLLLALTLLAVFLLARAGLISD